MGSVPGGSGSRLLPGGGAEGSGGGSFMAMARRTDTFLSPPEGYETNTFTFDSILGRGLGNTESTIKLT